MMLMFESIVVNIYLHNLAYQLTDQISVAVLSFYKLLFCPADSFDRAFF